MPCDIDMKGTKAGGGCLELCEGIGEGRGPGGDDERAKGVDGLTKDKKTGGAPREGVNPAAAAGRDGIAVRQSGPPKRD